MSRGRASWLVLLALPAAAFVTTRGDRTRWRFPPTWALGSATADLPADRLEAALARSFRPWTEVPGVDLPLTRVQGAADIRVDFLDPWPPELGPTVTGNTVTTTSGGLFVRAEIQLNDVVLDFTDEVDRAATYLPGVLTHEVGHALGLAHSPRLEATMYWHYQGPAGESLDGDDERGLRFLYAADPAPGEACDTCLETDDCAPGAWCLAVDGGNAYCGAPCAGGCPPGMDCVALRDGGESCWPHAGTCDDHGVGLRGRGEACWGANHCAAPLRCAVLPGGARCSADCDSDAACLPEERCLLGWGGATACAPVGAGREGAGCESDLDCAAGLCLGDPGARTCRRTCGLDAQCLEGERCAALGSPTGDWGGCVQSEAGRAGAGPDTPRPAGGRGPGGGLPAGRRRCPGLRAGDGTGGVCSGRSPVRRRVAAPVGLRAPAEGRAPMAPRLPAPRSMPGAKRQP